MEPVSAGLKPLTPIFLRGQPPGAAAATTSAEVIRLKARLQRFFPGIPARISRFQFLWPPDQAADTLLGRCEPMLLAPSLVIFWFFRDAPGNFLPILFVSRGGSPGISDGLAGAPHPHRSSSREGTMANVGLSSFVGRNRSSAGRNQFYWG
jgi:hypothetical protein